jgi:uncharacterized protein (DUF1501 family)
MENPMECPDAVQARLDAQDRLWDKGFTRRRFLGGVGMVGVAALATQLVTSRVSFSAAGASTGNTLIVIFMRGGADGLRILVPNAPSLGLTDLTAARPALVPATGSLLALPGAGGWALNGAMAPLMPYWNSGELGFVPAASVENLSRSHFQAQRLIESGGSPAASSGWLDRALTQLGPGTMFRAVTDGGSTPASLAGDEISLAIASLASFGLYWGPNGIPANQTAITSLYRGIDGFLGVDVPAAIQASQQAAALVAANPAPANGATYPNGNFSQALKDLANLLRANVGLEVATVDVGGWDTHTSEVSELDGVLTSAAASLAAFLQDLGPTLRATTTVVVMSEFGRRVAQNASGGTDHGHGSVMWLLGGGLKSSGVFGQWRGVAPSVLDQGDVPAANNSFDVLGELLQSRLNVGSLSTIFPGHSYSPLGFTRSASSTPTPTPTPSDSGSYTPPPFYLIPAASGTAS